jgi:hypothetical protein
MDYATAFEAGFDYATALEAGFGSLMNGKNN